MPGFERMIVFSTVASAKAYGTANWFSCRNVSICSAEDDVSTRQSTFPSRPLVNCRMASTLLMDALGDLVFSDNAEKWYLKEVSHIWNSTATKLFLSALSEKTRSPNTSVSKVAKSHDLANCSALPKSDLLRSLIAETLLSAPKRKSISKAFFSTGMEGGEMYGKSIGERTPRTFSWRTTWATLTLWISGTDSIVWGRGRLADVRAEEVEIGGRAGIMRKKEVQRFRWRKIGRRNEWCKWNYEVIKSNMSTIQI